MAAVKFRMLKFFLTYVKTLNNKFICTQQFRSTPFHYKVPINCFQFVGCKCLFLIIVNCCGCTIFWSNKLLSICWLQMPFSDNRKLLWLYYLLVQKSILIDSSKWHCSQTKYSIWHHDSLEKAKIITGTSSEMYKSPNRLVTHGLRKTWPSHLTHPARIATYGAEFFMHLTIK